MGTSGTPVPTYMSNTGQSTPKDTSFSLPVDLWIREMFDLTGRIFTSILCGVKFFFFFFFVVLTNLLD